MKKTNHPNLQKRLDTLGHTDNLVEYIGGAVPVKDGLLTEANFDSEVLPYSVLILSSTISLSRYIG